MQGGSRRWRHGSFKKKTGRRTKEKHASNGGRRRLRTNHRPRGPDPGTGGARGTAQGGARRAHGRGVVLLDGPGSAVRGAGRELPPQEQRVRVPGAPGRHPHGPRPRRRGPGQGRAPGARGVRDGVLLGERGALRPGQRGPHARPVRAGRGGAGRADRDDRGHRGGRPVAGLGAALKRGWAAGSFGVGRNPRVDHRCTENEEGGAVGGGCAHRKRRRAGRCARTVQLKKMNESGTSQIYPGPLLKFAVREGGAV